MAELPASEPESAHDSDAEFAGGSTSGTPRWVKVFGIVAAVVIVLLALLLFIGRGGEHGPGRHLSGSDGPDGHTGPPPGITHESP
jgi:hypothetical protein